MDINLISLLKCYPVGNNVQTIGQRQHQQLMQLDRDKVIHNTM